MNRLISLKYAKYGHKNAGHQKGPGWKVLIVIGRCCCLPSVILALSTSCTPSLVAFLHLRSLILLSILYSLPPFSPLILFYKGWEGEGRSYGIPCLFTSPPRPHPPSSCHSFSLTFPSNYEHEVKSSSTFPWPPLLSSSLPPCYLPYPHVTSTLPNFLRPPHSVIILLSSAQWTLREGEQEGRTHDILSPFAFLPALRIMPL